MKIQSEILRGKRVLITGAAGFIGTALGRILVSLGAEVFGVDIRCKSTANEPGVMCFQCDVREVQALTDVFLSYRPEVVFHLAAQTEVLASYALPGLTYSTNVTGTINILELCRRNYVKAVLLASTDKAYGDVRARHWTGKMYAFREDDELTSPCPDPYSSSKRLADLLAQDYARNLGLPLSIVRACNTYGPGQRNETTLITGTVMRILRGQPPSIHEGCEDVVREWMYIDDLVAAYVLLADRMLNRSSLLCTDHGSSPDPVVYNVGTGERKSAKMVVEGIKPLLPTVGASYSPTKTLATGVKQIGDQMLDSSLFNSVFPGWGVEVTNLHHGLAKTVEWYRDQHRDKTKVLKGHWDNGEREKTAETVSGS